MSLIFCRILKYPCISKYLIKLDGSMDFAMRIRTRITPLFVNFLPAGTGKQVKIALMESVKNILAFILLIFCITDINADYKSAIYDSYIGNNMVQWRAVIDKMNAERNKSNEFILELINYQYGYIAWCIGEGHHETGEKYLTLAENNLDYLENRSFKLSLVYSYRSALNGYKIGLNRLKAPFLGPRSVKYAKMAMELDPQNPYGYIQYGNSQFYMPAIFGGSKTLALEYFKKAEKLMEANKEKIKKDWNYLNLLAFIGKAYTETGDYYMAKEYYEKVLKIEPGFLWVKNELYPELLNKAK
jgi:tetratricopeptide (TPR) repeat protein